MAASDNGSFKYHNIKDGMTCNRTFFSVGLTDGHCRSKRNLTVRIPENEPQEICVTIAMQNASHTNQDLKQTKPEPKTDKKELEETVTFETAGVSTLEFRRHS